MKGFDLQKNERPPTLADVARRAGVSTATVSRCLNGTGRVSAEISARVTEAVEASGYTPNFAARVMSARRSHTIGAIIPTMANAIFARGIQAFEEALQARGYTLLVASSGYDPAKEQQLIRTLVSRRVDGLLLIGLERDADTYAYLSQYQVPAVAAWTCEIAAIATVGFDNRAAMKGLAQQVIEMGHRRLAMISGICAGNDRAFARKDGFTAALREAGLLDSNVQVQEVPYIVEAGEAACATLLKSANPPSAILCGNDVLAVGAMKAAREAGLTLPRDVSITGFDDLELAELVSPALTTIRVPHPDMGAIAADTLIQLVETGTQPKPIDLGTQIIMRGTLTSPAK